MATKSVHYTINHEVLMIDKGKLRRPCKKQPLIVTHIPT